MSASAFDTNASTTFAAEDSDHYTSRVKERAWATISSEHHFANAHVEVVTDRVRTPTRTRTAHLDDRASQSGRRHCADDAEGKIVLIRQERIPIHEAIWEMPSGQIDNHKAESRSKLNKSRCASFAKRPAMSCAEDGELIALGDYFSSPGFTDERGYFFLARPVVACAERYAARRIGIDFGLPRIQRFRKFAA